MQCSAVQCSAVKYSAVQCSAVQCSAVQCSTVQCSAVYSAERQPLILLLHVLIQTSRLAGMTLGHNLKLSTQFPDKSSSHSILFVIAGLTQLLWILSVLI